MSRIQLTDENSTHPEVRDIFDEIIERAGKVPAAYRAFAVHPHILQANWNRTKNILGKGNLSIHLKEAIALRVSTENGCNFCSSIHHQNLLKLGEPESKVLEIESGHVSDPILNFVLKFVSTATRNPEKITEVDFEILKKQGNSDADIVEILTVMEMYTGYNKIIVALGLKLED